nr:hypothetical protein [Tanacetum cinerariifolium]
MSTPMFVDPKSSTQADGAQSSRVPIPLPKNPYEAIRHAYLVGTDTESEPFEGKARTPESYHIVAPPACHVEESKGSCTSGARSTSSDSTAPLSPDHPLTHITPALIPILRRTARMAVRVSHAMSPGLSTGIAEVAAMSYLTFCKRFRSSYDSSPSPTLPIRKRYRGTSELILGTDSEDNEEVEESSDSDSEIKGTKDEGPTIEDEDPTAGDDGLAVGIEGPGVDDESFGLDDESHGVDDESRGLDDEGRGVEIDGLGLEEEEVVLGFSIRQLQLWGQLTFEVGQGSGSAPEPERSERVSASRQPTLTTWTDPEDGMTSGSLPISPSPSVVSSHVSSPMIPPSVPSSIALPMATSTATIPVDEDQFIEVGAQLELYRSILQDHTQRLDAMPPTLFAEIDRDVRELYNRSRAVKDDIFSQRYRFRSLEHEQERTVVTFGALWRPVLALKAWAGRVDTRMTDMSRLGGANRKMLDREWSRRMWKEL